MCLEIIKVKKKKRKISVGSIVFISYIIIVELNVKTNHEKPIEDACSILGTLCSLLYLHNYIGT